MCNLNRLLFFCRQHQKLICYGAGKYAGEIATVLSFYDIVFDLYCISCDKKILRRYMGKPLISFTACLDQDLSQAGFVIAVEDKYHKEIMEKLKQSNIKKYYFVGNKLIHNIHHNSRKCEFANQYLINLIRYGNINTIYTENEKNNFEQFFQKIIQNFQSIEIRYAPISFGGCMAYQKYYEDEFVNNTVFILLYPVGNINKNGKTDFSIPNKFLLTKMNGKNHDTLSNKNLRLWQYLLIVHSEYFQARAENLYFSEVIPKSVYVFRQQEFYHSQKCYLKLTMRDKKRGQEILQHHGIKGEFFVFFARDSTYYNKMFKNNDKLLSIMDLYRNSNIKHFQFAMERLYILLGIKAIRVGKMQDGKVNGKGIIDYANYFHNDFLDIYLGYSCAFFLGDSSGIIYMAIAFDKPVALTNMPFLLIHNDGLPPLSREKDLMIFQKYWYKKENRYLTFREMMEWEIKAKISHFKYSGITNILDIYYRNGIIPIKNTEEEIFDLALEMYQKTHNEIKYTDTEELLQEKFHSMVKNMAEKDKEWFWYDARIGSKFLLKNKWLLE
ncbi:TIGR04372 family glycosyltransferase [Pectinatus frisingensis]|uniref:TIGR04372 family glycosyltransferase n=1 Tax=Pectinatus frisingensis TaxID=865 RepID=UPI0018C5F7B6|nr:TIGR04372 family glycosyltransferase [Pectinatus frisingensis]